MRMPATAKGRRAPPPVLDGAPQAASEAIQAWPGVVASTHWHLSRSGAVDGADFYLGEEELGHIHLGGEVHLTSSAALAEALIGRSLAQRFPYGHDWVMTEIRTTDDADHAVWLFGLTRDLLSGVPEDDLLARIAARAAQAPISSPSA